VLLEMHADDTELTFDGNHTELQQCLLNLSLNAIQAMPEGGSLSIETTQVALLGSFFASDEEAHAGNYLRLTVSDTGLGMDEAVLQHLFEPFFTTKDSGTGLGLVSCKRIVTAHGGVMRVESTPGQGTRFYIYIPLERSAEATEKEEQFDLQGEAERVLVVAEEAGQLSLLVDTLDSWGYQAHASQSGTAALQWIEAQGVPDLVVMDADMNLFTGVRTLAALIDHGYRRAVLLLARPDAPPDMDELPVMEHLYMVDKPISTQKLLRTVREALEASAATQLPEGPL
jgi:CheY-like chemotaxis protein